MGVTRRLCNLGRYKVKTSDTGDIALILDFPGLMETDGAYVVNYHRHHTFEVPVSGRDLAACVRSGGLVACCSQC